MGLISSISKSVNKCIVISLSKDVVGDLSVGVIMGLIVGLIVGEGRYGSTTPGANKRVGIPPPRPLRNQD